MLPTAITPHAVDLSLIDATSEAEREHQRAIAKARRYHDGEQAVFLTSRLRAFLGIDLESDSRFNVNVCRIVVEAVAERLIIDLFDTSDDALKQWAVDVWRRNRMDARAADTHEMAIRDGESFLIVDWDEDNARPRLTPHPRYVSVEANGDGFGFEMFYPDNDASQQPAYAVKRWLETLESGVHRARATYYYPNRIEKFAYNGGWVQVNDADDMSWPIPWVDRAGQPLGIPVIHFQNKGLRSEAWDAIPIQDGLNKTFVDLLASADMTGFRIFVARGFYPTTDGLALNAEATNALEIEPGQIIGNTRPAGETAFQAIDGADPTPLVNMAQKLILFLAMVTNTPVGRFQISGLVSSEQSQKEANEPLLQKVRARQTVFGSAWEDVLDMARRLENLYGQALDDDAELTVQWAPAQARSGEETEKELRLKRDLGIPRKQLWAELGYDDETIETMLDDPEVRNLTFTSFP